MLMIYENFKTKNGIISNYRKKSLDSDYKND